MAQSPEGKAKSEIALVIPSKVSEGDKTLEKDEKASADESSHDESIDPLTIAENRIKQLKELIEKARVEGTLNPEQLRRKEISLREAERMMMIYKADLNLMQCSASR